MAERPDDDVVDPDVDLTDPDQRTETKPHELHLLAAIAAGGVVGAEARYGLGLALPHPDGAFPWSTVLINATGCLLIGVLMVVLLDLVERPHHLARPFLGVGVLGGYTTFSTFAVDVVALVHEHRIGVAAAYLVTTLVLGAAAVRLGTMATRIAAGRQAGGGS